MNGKQQLIVETLRAAGEPLSAYEIIDRLSGNGVSAPTTVYRALNRLIELGLAHRLESINAFVACQDENHGGTVAFAICEICGHVTEFHEQEAVSRLTQWASNAAFEIRQMALEIKGQCAMCSKVDP